MDKFFGMIGRFFKSIWEWIKTTAWVQPLLIVVIVFTIIFSFSANSPLMKWLKSISNSDPTGEFYDKHDADFIDIFYDVFSEDGKLPDGKEAGTLLKGYEGYSYVVLIQSDTDESTFRAFYDNILAKEDQKHFYVVDFRNEENLESYYNPTKGEWENNDGSLFYSYLLSKLYDFYVSDDFANLNAEFLKTYNYDIFFVDEWNVSSDISNAKSELKFPLICKFQGTELVDFRVCDNFDTNYSQSGSKVLQDFYKFNLASE